MYVSNEKAKELLLKHTGIEYTEEQHKIMDCEDGMCIISCAGSGKALKNGTGVLTPNGYVPIERLSVGDVCYDVNGEAQKVKGVYPQGEKDVYRVTFSDGNVIDCCKDHLWTYQTYNMRRTHKRWITDSLGDIMSKVPLRVYGHTCKKDGHRSTRANIYIPMSRAVEFSKKELQIDPYLLGAMLGDGILGNEEPGGTYYFTNNDKEIVDRVKDELIRLGVKLKQTDNPINFRLLAGHGCEGESGNESKFSRILGDLGIRGAKSATKFIPEIYKHSSVQDRLELIQGLIDTDGHCIGSSYEITLKSERLIDDIKYVVETLGMTAVKSERNSGYKKDGVYKDCGIVYRLHIKTSDEIPKIHWTTYKDKKWKRGQTTARRTITNIEKTDQVSEMTCIEVSGVTKLFLTENCIVTHNTLSIVHLIVKRILTGKIKNVNRLLVTTYSVAGREELETRINKLLRELGVRSKVEIRTLHSAFLYMLKKYGGGGFGSIIKPWQRSDFIKQSAQNAGLRMDEEDLLKLDSLISYQVNNMYTDEMIYNDYTFDLDIPRVKYSSIAAGYRELKNRAGLIDFDDMQTIVFSLLRRDKDAREMFRDIWDYFYIDEFQDVSKIQFEIIKMLLKDENKLVVIGDDDQCVYKWRGADPNIILNVCGYYDIWKHQLSTNYRCGAEIVKHAERGIRNNTQRMVKEMKAFNEGGRIVIDNNFKNMYGGSKAVYEHVLKLLKQGVKPEKIAILCRNNVHGVVLDDMINNISDTVTSKEMRFGNNQIVKDLKVCVELSKETFNHNVVRHLWKNVKFLKSSHAYSIAKIMSDNGCSNLVAIKSILVRIFDLRLEEGKDVKVLPTISNNHYKMQYNIHDTAVQGLVDYYNILCLEDEIERANGLIGAYLNVTVDFMYKGEDRIRSLYGIVEHVIRLIGELGVDDFDNHVRVAENNAKVRDIKPNGITLSTMHGSKGKEWDHVIILADDNISFPSFQTIRELVSTEQEVEHISDYIEQERRLHYVAMTRAKKELRVYVNPENMSVYLAEALGIIEKKDSLNSHVIEIANNKGYNHSQLSKIEEVVANYMEKNELEDSK